MPEGDPLRDAEARYTEQGQPTLGEAYRLLRERWRTGTRDRETALRLLFLSWYACAEPPQLTGLGDVEDPGGTFRAVYDHFGGEDGDDPEFLLVAGHMLALDPWCAGPVEEWASRGRACRDRWRQGGGVLPDPSAFAGRGAYGQYFSHIARVGWSGA